jgi:hypothetical protein
MHEAFSILERVLFAMLPSTGLAQLLNYPSLDTLPIVISRNRSLQPIFTARAVNLHHQD